MLENRGANGMIRLPIQRSKGFPNRVSTFWQFYCQIHPKGIARYQKSVYNI